MAKLGKDLLKLDSLLKESTVITELVKRIVKLEGKSATTKTSGNKRKN